MFWALLALVCLLQTIYPTLLGWGVVSLVFFLGLVTYTYVFIVDLFGVWQGDHPQIFLAPFDTIAFLTLFSILVIVAVGLVFAKPKSPLP